MAQNFYNVTAFNKVYTFFKRYNNGVYFFLFLKCLKNDKDGELKKDIDSDYHCHYSSIYPLCRFHLGLNIYDSNLVAYHYYDFLLSYQGLNIYTTNMLKRIRLQFEDTLRMV